VSYLVRAKKISQVGSQFKVLQNVSALNIKTIEKITNIVTSYDYDKFGRVIGTRKEAWDSSRPALTASTYETAKYASLGRKAQSESPVGQQGIDINADEISNIEYDANGNIISFQYSKDGKIYTISNITYYGDGPYKGYITSYLHSDGKITVQYSNMRYDETGTLIYFIKTLLDGTKEYHSISRDMSGQVTQYVIRNEKNQPTASFKF